MAGAERPGRASGVTLVLFDLDHVLADYDRARRIEELARRSGASVEDVRSALFDSGLEDRADRGEISAGVQAAILSEALRAPITVGDCVAARAAAMDVDTAVLPLLARIAPPVATAILTNNGFLVRDWFADLCPELATRFAGRVHCSAEFGVMKPDPAVFHRCLAALGAAPEATAFIDDRPENVAGARSIGIAGHVYRDAAGLAEFLEAVGAFGPSAAVSDR